MTAPGGHDVPSPRRVGEDLGYVRDVVGRSERDATPRAIWYLWAAIGGIGFALIDFRPERDAEVLRSLTDLEQINEMPAAEFWKAHEK